MTMNAATETFEQFATAHAVPADRLDVARALWTQERAADASRPSTVPPCPPWCALPDGHPYDSYSGPADDVTHTRLHHRPVGMADVHAAEHHTAGVVELTATEITCGKSETLSAAEALILAADLQRAVDVLGASE